MRTIVIGTQGHNSGFISYLLVPKLQLGNAVFEAPASLRTTNRQAGACKTQGSQAGAWEPAEKTLCFALTLRRCAVA